MFSIQQDVLNDLVGIRSCYMKLHIMDKTILDNTIDLPIDILTFHASTIASPSTIAAITNSTSSDTDNSNQDVN